MGYNNVHILQRTTKRSVKVHANGISDTGMVIGITSFHLVLVCMNMYLSHTECLCVTFQFYGSSPPQSTRRNFFPGAESENGWDSVCWDL